MPSRGIGDDRSPTVEDEIAHAGRIRHSHAVGPDSDRSTRLRAGGRCSRESDGGRVPNRGTSESAGRVATAARTTPCPRCGAAIARLSRSWSVKGAWCSRPRRSTLLPAKHHGQVVPSIVTPLPSNVGDSAVDCSERLGVIDRDQTRHYGARICSRPSSFLSFSELVVPLVWRIK